MKDKTDPSLRATAMLAGIRVVGTLMLISMTATTPLNAQRLDHLSIEQGLSHGAVHAIIQDQQGLMHFGTEDGLNTYDGYSITVSRHEPSNPNSLTSSNFGKIYEDRAGILWFGTWGGGLDRYDPRTGTFTHYVHDPDDPNSLSSNRIEFIYEDHAGLLWIGTESDGLNRFVPETGHFIRYQHDPDDPNSLGNDRALAVWEDEDGTLWIGTDRGLDRFDRQSETFITAYRHDEDNPSSLSSSRIRALAGDDDGHLWIGTRGGGLNRLDRATGQIRRFLHDPAEPTSLSDNAVARLFVDSQGTLWVSTYTGGLNRYHPETESFSHYTYDPRDPKSLSHNRVEAFWEDRSGVLWLGTRGGGVNMLDLKPKKFTNYTHDPEEPNGLPHPSVRDIAQAPGDDNTLWIGTDGGGLTRFDRAGNLFHHFRNDPDDANSLSSDRVLTLHIDSTGTLWVGTYTGGLNRVTPRGNRYQFTSYQHDPDDPRSLSHNRVLSLFETREGTLWVGTAEGLNRLRRTPDGAASFDIFRHDPADETSLNDSYVIVMTQDRAGTLWIGTRSGLHAFDARTDSFRRYLHDPADKQSLSSNIIQAIHEDDTAPGTLWIGTEDGGLNKLDVATGVFTHYLERDGLPSNVIDGVLQDEAGALWLSTSRGLSRFEPTTNTFRNYDRFDGLFSHSFIRNSSWESPSGEMFFGSIAGLAAFFPDRVQDNPHVPAIILTSFKKFNEEVVFDQPLNTLDEIALSYKDNFFSIEFAAMDYTVPEKNQYAYWLEGVDPEWIEAGHRNYANYTKLDPGNYVFHVRGSNNDGVWNEEGVRVRLRITPPFWQTWWFRIGGILVLFLLTLGAYQLRTRAIRARNKYLRDLNARLNEHIAERKRTEAEREQFVEELEAKNAELERFTYTVSHDLKSPIVTIKGFLGLLENDLAQNDLDRARQDLAQIHTATDKMHRLLGELLELSRIGRQINPTETISLTELAREAAAMVAGRIVARGVEVDIAPEMPTVLGDRVRLLEVYQNLVENAVKFMGDQAAPRIEIGGWRDKDEVICYVRDNGIGIAPEYQEQIFGLFERLTTSGEGTGVGLALVRRIVEVHGGRIWVESEGEGHGATFWFVLPQNGTEAHHVT